MANPPPTKSETAQSIAGMIGIVDERARDVNRQWGMNRLPNLVPAEWQEKFRKQKRAWEMACFECSGSLMPDDRDRVNKQGEAMLRAFDKLEQLARDAGHMPSQPDWWEFELKDGTPVMLVRDRAEMSQIDPRGRAVQIWSLEEVSDIIAKFPMIATAKECFPGAETIQCRTNPLVIDELNDSLDNLPWDAKEPA